MSGTDNMKIATLFSGGGLVDIGAMQAGWQPVWAIEYDPSISDSYRQNIGDHILTADVCDVDYSQLPSVDWLHASPSCVNASRAKAHNGETEGDVRCAEAVVRALQAQQPQFFTLENVWTYRNFESFRMILNAVADLGYFYDFNHLNMANYGVPQNRWRLFLIASRGFLPVLYSSKPTCWLTAVQDLLPELRKSEFPKWQQRKLESNRLAEFVVNGANASSEYSFPIVAPNSPPGCKLTAKFCRRLLDATLVGRQCQIATFCRITKRWPAKSLVMVSPVNLCVGLVNQLAL
jgi:DNA-cytosine methyltransferase